MLVVGGGNGTFSSVALHGAAAAGVRGVLCWRHPPLTCTPLPQRFTNERKDKIKHQKTNFQKKSIITNTIKDKGDSNNTATAANQVRN